MQVGNWNDLRYLLALSRMGTLTAAASSLGVDQTTVTRRLRALETDSGAELYEKLRGGALFTPAGTEMVATAERLEAEMVDLEARLEGGHSRVEGKVRLTMSPYLAIELIEEVRGFVAKFPGIDLELITTDDIHSLSKREADVALRVAARLKVPEHLVGRKLSACTVAVYGVPGLQEVPWPEVPWVGWLDLEGRASVVREFHQKFGGGPVSFLATAGSTYLEAVRAGAGVGLFLCGCPRLTRGLVQLTDPSQIGDYWMLTHPDLQRSPRIRATLEYWYEVVEGRAAALSGEG
jgi:DNA-binding transcriptional LysR family regulator